MSFQFKKTLPEAIAPFKVRDSDSGYDLTLIKFIKELNGVEYYDTGVSVCPPEGYYFDIVPRSSSCKYGYTLANNVGVIDAEYRGSIIVPLFKFERTSHSLQEHLPIRFVQMIPREIKHFIPVEVTELDETSRGIGGFGSSGKN